jgi:hypothetical protein
MVTRRKFLTALAILPALTALGGAGLRLPARKDVEFEASPYLTSKDTWYLKTEHADGLKYFNRVSPGADLTEASIEDMVKQIRALTDNEVMRVFPTKLIVHPSMAKRAKAIIEHRPGFFERLWWRLTYFEPR